MLPSADKPLYSHPLPEIEQWLVSQGCERDEDDPHCWLVQHDGWQARVCLEVDCLTVRYFGAGEDGRDIQRSFKYSLSRRDLDEAIFTEP